MIRGSGEKRYELKDKKRRPWKETIGQKHE